MTEISSVSGPRGVREAQIAMRDACFSDMIALIKICHEAVPAGTDGKEALAALYESAEEKGVEGFGAALSLPPSPQAATVSIEAYTYLAHEYCYSNCNEKWNENLEEHDLFCQRAHELLRSAGAQGQVQGGVQASETDEVRRVRQSYRLWDGRAADVSGQEGLREPTNEHELLVGGIVRAALELAILRGDLRMDNGAAFEEMSESEREDVISDTMSQQGRDR